jgi:hypothetical protein
MEILSAYSTRITQFCLHFLHVSPNFFYVFYTCHPILSAFLHVSPNFVCIFYTYHTILSALSTRVTQFCLRFPHVSPNFVCIFDTCHPIRMQFETVNSHENSQSVNFRDNRSREGHTPILLNIAFSPYLRLYDILKAKNALVKSIYHLTEYRFTGGTRELICLWHKPGTSRARFPMVSSFDFGATASPPPPVGHGLLILEVSRSHTMTHHSR